MGKGRAPLFALALAAAATASGGPDTELANQLRSARKSFEEATAKSDPAAIRRTLADVVGVAAATAARAPAPPGVAAHLDAAHASLRAGTGSFPDAGAVKELGEAYAALQGGRAFSIPAGVGTFDQALGACRRELDSAVAALESGRREDALRGMIAFALLVTTPIAAN